MKVEIITIYKVYISILLSLLFATCFMWSEELMDGLLTAKTFYFYGISSLIFLSVGVYLLFLKKEPFELKFNRLDIYVILFVFYCFIRILFTPYTSIDNTQFIILLFLTALSFIWKRIIILDENGNPGLTTKILITSFLLSGLLQALYGILQLYDLSPGLESNYFKVIGTFGNPDSFSGYMVSIMPFAFGIYTFTKKNSNWEKFIKYLGLITFIACIYILPPAYIRAAWLAGGIGILYILWHKKNWGDKLKQYLNTFIKKITAVAAAIIILALVISALYILKPNSAFGRLFIWKVTTNIISESPIFGIGYNRYAVDYNTYQAEYFANGNGSEYEKLVAGNVRQAHNEYLQLFAELGIVSLMIFFGIIYIVLHHNKVKEHPFHERRKEQTITVISAKGGIISILICSIFSFPLHILPTFINLMFLLSITDTIIMDSKEMYIKINTFIYKLGIVIAFTIIFLFISNLSLNYEAYIRWKLSYSFSHLGLLENAEKEYYNIYTPLKNNGKFLFNFGGMLVLKEDYGKARKYLEVAKLNFNDPNLYIALGRCYEGLNNFGKAEENYLCASNMIPHKLYSKYLLTKLYFNYKKYKNAKKMAKLIVNMQIKIPSTAVKEMKAEMKELIEKI